MWRLLFEFSFCLLWIMKPQLAFSTELGKDCATYPAKNLQADPILVVVPHNVTVRNYFPYLDSIVVSYNCLLDYRITEYTLVLTNSWIIDTLVHTDYYIQMQRGNFIYDQRDIVVLHQGDTLVVPDEQQNAEIQLRLENTVIDVNIPEFKLRIIENDSVKYTFPVRVGRNENKYLKTAGREVSLRTPIGQGEIVRVERNPIFVDPASGKRYTSTKRDDGKYTLMPQIPWLEPSTNGKRLGALIHPTTNPKTLGKVYSNGCVGTGEGEAWIIYYHAPLGTKVNFRYDLEVTGESGEIIELKDIYQLRKKPESKIQETEF